jgi:hypothetical protein
MRAARFFFALRSTFGFPRPGRPSAMSPSRTRNATDYRSGNKQTRAVRAQVCSEVAEGVSAFVIEIYIIFTSL